MHYIICSVLDKKTFIFDIIERQREREREREREYYILLII